MREFRCESLTCGPDLEMTQKLEAKYRDKVSFIQRLNTVGGKAPARPGAFPGQVARVPYTADYYFYRKVR